MKRWVVTVLLLAALVPADEAAHLAQWFGQWRAYCHNTFLGSRATAGVTLDERVYKVARDCVEAAERERFPYLDLARSYAVARGLAEYQQATDPGKGAEALAALATLDPDVLSEIARREEADRANQLRAREILREAQEAERRRQEMQGLRDEVRGLREAAEGIQEELERARRRGVTCWRIGNMVTCR